MRRVLVLVGLVVVLTGCGHKSEPERAGDEFGASGADLQYGTCKDCIPAIDEPQFESKDEANEWLEDEDLVVGLDYQGEHKAYPVKILNWHEIVNDKVIVTYSSLCGSAVVFASEVTWREWQTAHPTTVVLSAEIGGDRDYEVNPYPELAQREVVYEVEVGEETKVYSLEVIKRETADDGVLMDVVGGEKIRLSYSQGEIMVENLKTKQKIIPVRLLSR